MRSAAQCFSFLCFFMSMPGFAAETELGVAVIGGLDMSGVWTRIEAAAEAELGLDISTEVAAPKEEVVPAFMRGDVDLLLIHGGDETFALEALGYASALRTWGYNDFVFVGPEADPAGIASATSGSEVMRLLQASQQPLISFRDIGSQQVVRRLMEGTGLIPAQFNLITDRVERAQQILTQASEDNAYVVVGHMPVAFGRMQSEGVKILYGGDPGMRRAYVIVTPGPLHPAGSAARANAERLATYLVSEAGQALLAESGPAAGVPWIYPRASGGGLLDLPARNRTTRGKRAR